MQNVLTFPSDYVAKTKYPLKRTKKSLVKKIVDFIKTRKTRKEQIFKKKMDFLVEQTYFDFLRQVLKNKKQNELDFPDWFYKKGITRSGELDSMAKSTVYWINHIYGRKHIEKCYKARKKELATMK